MNRTSLDSEERKRKMPLRKGLCAVTNTVFLFNLFAQGVLCPAPSPNVLFLLPSAFDGEILPSILKIVIYDQLKRAALEVL